jgi:hypothetical protein
MGMFGNGVRIIGMIIIMELLQMEALGKMKVTQAGLFGAVTGSMAICCAGRRAATSSNPTTVIAASVSAS